MRGNILHTVPLKPALLFLTPSSPTDVLKCKKDKALPGGQLCPMCSSPRWVRKEELLTVMSLECSRPVISSPRGTPSPDDVESELLTKEDFADPFGNVSLGLSDEHGNKVDLECNVREPRDLSSISWEQSGERELLVNVSLSVDIECIVDRGRYEQLWRLIAYYSSVPAHLQRGPMIREKPHPSYIYKQDSEKDAQYYTGVKVDVSAQPSWLMQKSAGLRLNRLRSSAKTVYLVLSANLVETAEVGLLRTQRRPWVTIASTNKTCKASSAILGTASQMDCSVHSSSAAAIRWMLPDGTTVEAPYSSADNSVSVSAEGQLSIEAVRHTDAGIFYCVAKVEGDLAVLPFHLSVQEPSGPPPGEGHASAASIEGFAGSPISLPCVSSGSPDAGIHWILPSSDSVSFQANTSKAFVFPNGTLHIPRTHLTDAGYYKCVAINQYGVDTAVIRVTLVRRKVTVRPLRKSPARPQSASGINTQIKVPTENAEEGSGESEVPPVVLLRRPSEPIRRRIPGGTATGRRAAHPLRRPWRRPVLRKPTELQLEDRRAVVDSRRKSKIDPEKWADILAKIRDRKAQTTATPLPAQHATEVPVLEPATLSEDAIEGSSDAVTPLEEAWEEHHTTMAETPVKQTQVRPDTQDAQAQGVHVTDIGKVLETEAVTPTTHHIHTTYGIEGPQTMYNVQSITLDTNLDARMSSNGEVFFPQTTSVSPSAVTLWQASANTGGSLFPLTGNRSKDTDMDRDVGADWSVDRGRSGSIDADNLLSGSENTFVVNVSGRETESGKYVSNAATKSRIELEATTQDCAQPQLSPSPTEAPLSTRRRSRPRLGGVNGRRKIGGPRKRPKGRKQKPNKTIRFSTATPAHSLAVTERAITYLSGVTETSSTAAVPFRSSQAASSDPLSHGGSTALLLGARATTGPSVVAPPQKTEVEILPLAGQLFEGTTVAPSLSMVFAVTGPRILAPPTTKGTLEASSPAGSFGEHTASPQRRTLGRLTPGLSEEAGLATKGSELLENYDDSSGDFGTVTQTLTNTRLDLSPLDTPTQRDETGLMRESDSHFSATPPSPIAVVLPLNHGSTSEGPLTALSGLLEIDVDKTHFATGGTSTPEETNHSSNRSNFPKSESEGLEAATTSWHSSIASLTPKGVIPTTGVLYAAATALVGHNVHPSLSATTVPDDHSQIQQTSVPQRAPDLRRVTQLTNYSLYLLAVHPTSPAAELISRETGQQVASPVPTVNALQTDAPGRGPPTSTLSTYERHQQLPRQGSAPGRKPSITKSNFQMYVVRAEADVRLPCKAASEPMPFLSWTKVASGMYD